MQWSLYTPASDTPVSLAELRAHLRLEASEEEADDLTLKLAAAVQYCEEHCWSTFSPAVWETKLDGFPDCENFIQLPRGPLISIDLVQYVDTSGTTQTMSASDYVPDYEASRLVLAYNEAWPTTRYQRNAVTIRHRNGYQTMPPAIKQAVILKAEHFYAPPDGDGKPLLDAVHSLLSLYTYRTVR